MRKQYLVDYWGTKGIERGRVVRARDLESRGCGFTLALLSSPEFSPSVTLANRQLVRLQPVGYLTTFCSLTLYLFLHLFPLALESSIGGIVKSGGRWVRVQLLGHACKYPTAPPPTICFLFHVLFICFLHLFICFIICCGQLR